MRRVFNKGTCWKPSAIKIRIRYPYPLSCVRDDDIFKTTTRVRVSLSSHPFPKFLIVIALEKLSIGMFVVNPSED